MAPLMQMRLTTLNVEVGLSYDEALELIEENKGQLEKYGSRLPIANVGFYVRKRPVNRLDTGYDHIALVTGLIHVSGDGGNKKILHRAPWHRNAYSPLWDHFKMHWKLEKSEARARKLWNFWYKCVHRLT